MCRIEFLFSKDRTPDVVAKLRTALKGTGWLIQYTDVPEDVLSMVSMIAPGNTDLQSDWTALPRQELRKLLQPGDKFVITMHMDWNRVMEA